MPLSLNRLVEQFPELAAIPCAELDRQFRTALAQHARGRARKKGSDIQIIEEFVEEREYLKHLRKQQLVEQFRKKIEVQLTRQRTSLSQQWLMPMADFFEQWLHERDARIEELLRLETRGRPPDYVERRLLLALAKIWTQCGKRITHSARSRFVRLCAEVLRETGIDTEADEANLADKIRRLDFHSRVGK